MTTKASPKGTKSSRCKPIAKTEVDPVRIREIAREIFGENLHAARLRSLVNGVVGTIEGAKMGIHAIGQAYALSAGIKPKSGVNQTDRLLGNQGIRVYELQQQLAGFVAGGRTELTLAMDWTDFDGDGHSTLAVYVMTNHGRATPLAWHTYRKCELKGRMREYECDMIELLHEWFDPNTRITLLADRGFGDQKVYELLLTLGWDFVVRFRGNIHVTTRDGVTRTAQQWVGARGRAKMLRQVRVTADEFEVPAVVVVWDKGMKQSWCLATSLSSHRASNVVKCYGRRFTIEETFRDQKDPLFGMGLSATHIRTASRRDRLLLLGATAHILLTLLGAASERVGMDKYLKVNTCKRRTHSLYRQGQYWYSAIPTMRQDWLIPLLRAFDDVLREHQSICSVLGSLCASDLHRQSGE